MAVEFEFVFATLFIPESNKTRIADVVAFVTEMSLPFYHFKLCVCVCVIKVSPQFL